MSKFAGITVTSRNAYYESRSSPSGRRAARATDVNVEAGVLFKDTPALRLGEQSMKTELHKLVYFTVP
jgi:hypothetical protein